MRKILPLVLIIFFVFTLFSKPFRTFITELVVNPSSQLAQSVSTWTDIGFNFRGGTGYVTDGANETYVRADTYPTTRSGATFGWTATLIDGTRDRNASNDRRLAGINQKSNNGTQATFRVDLPSSGDYDIGLALGDAGYEQGVQYAQVLDGSTSLFTINDTNGTAINHFDDANGTNFSQATWPGSNALRRVNVSGTTLNVVIGTPTAQANSSTIAHLRIVKVGSSTPPPVPPPTPPPTTPPPTTPPPITPPPTTPPTPPPTPPSSPSLISINNNCSAYATPTIPSPLRTFYVDSVSGSDTNNGTSLVTAWRTLSRANTSAQPGDLILLKGTFPAQSIRPLVSGTASNKIVYRVLSGNSAVITTGTYDVAIWLDSLNHVVVDGIEVSNTTNPILIRYGGSNNWLLNLNVHNSGTSQILGSSDNRIENSRFDSIGSESSNAGDTIFIGNASHRNIIARNTFTNAGHGAIWISYQSAGEATSNDNIIAQNDISNTWASVVGLNGTANRTIVECNNIHHSADGSRVNYARDTVEIEGTNNIIRYNLIHHAGAAGVSIQGRTFFGRVQNPSGNHIYNNTFWRNGLAGGHASLEFTQRDTGIVRNNTVENNIFWNDVGFAYGGTNYAVWFDMFNTSSGNTLPAGNVGGNIVRYNTFSSGHSALIMIRTGASGGNTTYTFSQILSAIPSWQNLIQNNPLFVNESSSDVSLQSGSPAINSGIAISGFSHQGSAPDMGAYESSSSSTPPPTPPTPSTPVALAGDLNLDHIVNSLDWSIMNSRWFTSDATADINGDGLVNSIDFSILNNNWFGTW